MFGITLNANGDVLTTIDADPLPAGYEDATALSAALQADIRSRRVRRVVGVWQPIPAVVLPAIAGLNDRQLMEAIAIGLGVARR